MGSYALPARPSYAPRGIVLLLVAVLSELLFGPALKGILELSFRDDRYLQIAAGPLVCLILLFWERADIFEPARYSPRQGIPLVSTVLLISIAIRSYTGVLLPQVGGLILLWIATFVLCCGVETARKAIYPLSCLLLMLPVPASWADNAVVALQHGSAAVAYQLFRLLGIPVVRNGMAFSMPGLDFQVAPECSGIHSTIALGLIAVVCSYLYLRSGRVRFALILLTVPIAIFKNALRIVALSTLGAYVNPTFFTGPFHHRYGGIVFSVVAIALFVPVLAGLQRLETWRPNKGRA